MPCPNSPSLPALPCPALARPAPGPPQVRQAEMEGEYLEAKRQLLRTREKNLQASVCAHRPLHAHTTPWHGRRWAPPCSRIPAMRQAPCRVSRPVQRCCRASRGVWYLWKDQHARTELISLFLFSVSPDPTPSPALQLARKLQDIKEAAERGEPLPLTPKGGTGGGGGAAGLAASPAAMPLAEAITPQSESKKRSSFRLPGL